MNYEEARSLLLAAYPSGQLILVENRDGWLSLISGNAKAELKNEQEEEAANVIAAASDPSYSVTVDHREFHGLLEECGRAWRLRAASPQNPTGQAGKS